MKHHIYADNAATTKMDPQAVDVMLRLLSSEYANASQTYSFSRSCRSILRESREVIAHCINADPDEIFFTSGGTESDNWALLGISNSNSSKKRIITSAFEHHAILNNAERLSELGVKMIYLNPSKTGHVQSSELATRIDDDTRLVSVMLVNNELGTIQPIKELCKIAHEHGSLFHTDAVQAMGHIEIDVKDLGVDLLSASAHKFNGPKGVGFLYIRKGVDISPFVLGGGQEKGMRAGTENIPAIASMAIALKNNVDCLDSNISHLDSLEKTFLQELDNLNVCYHLNASYPKVPGIINLSFDKITGESLQIQLDLEGIYISTGSACDSMNTEISHVLKSINLEPAYSLNAVRISFGKYNSNEDAINVASVISRILSRY